MSWNYRVVKIIYPNGEECFGIHEAYYGPAGVENYKPALDEKPTGLTIAIAPIAGSIEGLRDVLQRMLEACYKPVLNDEDFKMLK